MGHAYVWFGIVTPLGTLAAALWLLHWAGR